MQRITLPHMKDRIYLILFLLLSTILLLGLGCRQVSAVLQDDSERPEQRQPVERIKEISELDIQRAGRVKHSVLYLDDNAEAGQTTRISYLLRAPAAVVEDTEIRGFLDGAAKYPFNQSTSYHMRVGRRFDGAYRGEYELKRSLIRWTLPHLPTGAHVVSAQVTLWVEEYYGNSPFAKSDDPVMLHLYLYPLSADWGPGHGGINQDSFSPAAPGEVSWTEARAGKKEWPAPGALALDTENPDRRYKDDPLVVATIIEDNSELTASSERLAEYLQKTFDEGRTFDILLKLDDLEEDQIGTETAIFTSNFGDDKDIAGKRPTLEFEIELDLPEISTESVFVLEPGAEYVLPTLEHPGGSVLLSTTINSQDGGIPPEIWIRGGQMGVEPQNDWLRYDQPLEVDWEWSQVKLSAAHNRQRWGELFSINILETWVRPGPRELQIPELVLVAPSGKIHRVEGRAMPDLSYLIEFQPQELGLWKYGWSFLPRLLNKAGSHQGDGLFFIDIPRDDSEAQILKQYADYLKVSLRAGDPSDQALQRQVNTFIRRAMEFAQNDPHAQQTSEQLISEIRQVMTDRRNTVRQSGRLNYLMQSVKRAIGL